MSMGGSKGMIKDNGSIAKIASALYYKAAALDYLVNSSLTQKAVKTKIDLSTLGYVVKESLYGIEAQGSLISINTSEPSQAVWVLESSQKLSG